MHLEKRQKPKERGRRKNKCSRTFKYKKWIHSVPCIYLLTKVEARSEAQAHTPQDGAVCVKAWSSPAVQTPQGRHPDNAN